MGKRSWISDFVRYARYSRGWEIAKRYFAIEMFDTALIVISVMTSSLVFNVRDVRTVSGILINIALAGVMAGVTIVVLVESVEREKELEEIERALLTNLDGTVIQKSMLVSIALSGLMQVLGVVLPILIPIVAMLIFPSGMVSNVLVAVVIGIEMVLLFSIGFVLGGTLRRAVLVGLVSVALGILLTVVGATLTPSI